MSSHTKNDWVAFTPKGKEIVFKSDTGVCKGMPYIYLRTNKAGLAMVKTVRKNFESHAKKREIEKAKLYCNVRSMIGHPSNKHYTQIVIRKDLKNCTIDVDDVKSAKVIFGPYQPGLKGWST